MDDSNGIPFVSLYSPGSRASKTALRRVIESRNADVRTLIDRLREEINLRNSLSKTVGILEEQLAAERAEKDINERKTIRLTALDRALDRFAQQTEADILGRAATFEQYIINGTVPANTTEAQP